MTARSTTGLLVRLLRDPHALLELTPATWNALIPVLRGARLMAHLGVVARHAGVFDQLPDAFRDLSRGSLARVEHLQRLSLYIAEEITERLSAQGIRMALLKGAAYAAAGYAFAEGRMFSDLDILVRREDLERAEGVLRSDGWKPDDMDAADERYYREWIHELPPFKHPTVPLELDVHHNLAPPVSRIQVDMTPFWRDAVSTSDRGITVLCSPHMLIHTAVHLFFNDELRGGLRELLDVHGLCRLAPVTPGFWEEVVTVSLPRPMLARTLFYALDTARRHLETPVDEAALQSLRPADLTKRHLAVMRWLFDLALLEDRALGTPLAKQALFIRSHWLRMPLRLLAPHLARKAWLRVATKGR
jgi:hypothetical protein